MPRKHRPRPPVSRAVRAAASGPRPEPAPEPRSALLVAWGVLAALVVFSYGKVVPLGFSNDDFLILETVALRSVTRMVAWSHMIAGWWRPWSRELHFRVLHRLFGVHAASQDLWMLLLGEAFLLAQLARRRTIAPVALAPALPSKETAALRWARSSGGRVTGAG